MDWWVHRVATCDTYKDSVADILHRWTLKNLMDAHLMLDLFEQMDAADRAATAADRAGSGA